MSGMANQIREQMAADGIDTSGTVADAMRDADGSPAAGTGGDPTPPPVATPPAGVSNTDGDRTGSQPDTIPYSRFAEVNSRLQELRQYEQLGNLGISPDSAVRLASFEEAYRQDPTGTIAAMVDQQDLPDAQKTALKALLGKQDAALSDATDDDDRGPQLSVEERELLDWAKSARQRESDAETQGRLDLMTSRWQQRDEADGVTGVTPRQRLLYISNVAGSGRQFTTLEEMADAARDTFLEDRDANLGGAVQRRGPGGPLAVPSGGLPPTQAMTPRSMSEARKLIEADIAAGRLPDLSPQG